MLEHIFRNIDDIRIFDTMTEFVIGEEKQKNIDKIPLESIKSDVIDIDDIMEMLDYGEYKRASVEDSIDHLIRQKILGVVKIKTEGKTGCKICKYLDKMNIPRFGEHKTHVAEYISIGYLESYYMLSNEITNGLISAVFAHVFLTVEEDIEDVEETGSKDKDNKDNVKKEDNREGKNE